MEKNKIIIIALIVTIAVLAVCISYALLNPSVEYEKVNLSNGTTIDVPKADDSSWKKDANGIRTYTCKSKHTVMTSFNSQEDLNLVGAGAFALSRDMLLNGATDVEKYGKYQIKENTINGTHYYIVYISDNKTHDNIMIGSENLDIIKHMVDSLRLGPPGEGQANATVEQTQTTAPKTVNSTDDENKYSEDDLMLAAREGYYYGYSDGYDDSYNIYTDDSSYDTDYGQSDSYSSDSDYYDDYEDDEDY